MSDPIQIISKKIIPQEATTKFNKSLVLEHLERNILSHWDTWGKFQQAWTSRAYKSFNDLDKYVVLIYLIHLLFNTTWSIVFFVFHNISLAFLNLIVLIMFIVILTVKFKHISIVSYYLMIPYLLWSFYALILNGTLLYLN